MDVPVYKKLVDLERQQENPYHTAEGLTAVSEAENFWVRLSREGTHVSSYKGVAIDNTLKIQEIARPGAGRRLYPKRIILTSTVRTLALITWYTSYGRTIEPTTNSMPTIEYQQVVLPPNQCVIINYDGDMFLDGGDVPLQIRSNTLVPSETGTIYMSVDGWEVSVNA